VLDSGLNRLGTDGAYTNEYAGRGVTDKIETVTARATNCRKTRRHRGIAFALCSAQPFMVIEATTIFRCTHSYIGAPRSSTFMFVCHQCGHRAEFLPFRLPRASRTIVSFPITRANPDTAREENSTRDSKPVSLSPSAPIVRDRPHRLRSVSGSPRDHRSTGRGRDAMRLDVARR
jgi:hypothetical protein